MSWKLFGQIVLLMVIAAVLLCTMKCCMMRCKMMCKAEHYMQMKQHCMMMGQGQMADKTCKR